MPRSLRRGLLVSFLVVALAPALPGQVSARWSACKSDSLSNFNCASYYTGTVTLSSDLKGANINQSLRIVATVTAGKVTCQTRGTETGDIDGPGMLFVEHENTENAGEYRISVWCPESAGKRPTRNDAPLIEIMDQQSRDYGTLEGKDSYDNPNSDEANGLSGTETVTWALRR